MSVTTHKTATSKDGSRSIASAAADIQWPVRETMLAGMAGMINPELLPDVSETPEERAMKQEKLRDDEMEMLLGNLIEGSRGWLYSENSKKEIWLQLSSDFMKLHFRDVQQKKWVDSAKQKMKADTAKLSKKLSEKEKKRGDDKSASQPIDVGKIAVPDPIKKCTLFISDIEDGDDGVFILPKNPKSQSKWDPAFASDSCWKLAIEDGRDPRHCIHIQYRDFITGRMSDLRLSFKEAQWETTPGTYDTLRASHVCRRWQNGLKCLLYGGYGTIVLPTAAERSQINPMSIWLEKIWVYADESGDGKVNVRDELSTVLTFCNIRQKRVFKLVADILSSEVEYKTLDVPTILEHIEEGTVELNRLQLQKLMWQLRNHDIVNQLFAEFAKGRVKMRLKSEGTTGAFDTYVYQQDQERDARAKLKAKEKRLVSTYSNDLPQLKEQLRNLKEEKEFLRKQGKAKRSQMILLFQEEILNYHKTEVSKGKFTTFLMHSSLNSAFNPFCIAEKEWGSGFTTADHNKNALPWNRTLKDFYISTSINTAYGFLSNTIETTFLPYGCTKVLTPTESVARVLQEYNPRAIHFAPRGGKVGQRSKINWKISAGGYRKSFPSGKKPANIFDCESARAGGPKRKDHPGPFYKNIRENGEPFRDVLAIVKQNAFTYSPTPFIIVIEINDTTDISEQNSIAQSLKDVLGIPDKQHHCTCSTLGRASSHFTIVTNSELLEVPSGCSAEGQSLTAHKSVKDLGGVSNLSLNLLYNRFIIALKVSLTTSPTSEWIPFTKRRIQSELTQLATLEFMLSASRDRETQNCQEILKQQLIESLIPVKIDDWESPPKSIEWPVLCSGLEYANDEPSERRKSRRKSVMSQTAAEAQKSENPMHLMRRKSSYREHSGTSSLVCCISQDELETKLDQVEKWQLRQMRDERRVIINKDKTEGLVLPREEAELPQQSDYLHELHVFTKEHLTFCTSDVEPHHRLFQVGDKIAFTNNGESCTGTISSWKFDADNPTTEPQFLIKVNGRDRPLLSRDCSHIKRNGPTSGEDKNHKWGKWKRTGVHSAFSAGAQLVGIDYLPNPHTVEGEEAIALRSAYRSKFRMAHKGSFGYLLKPSHMLSEPIKQKQSDDNINTDNEDVSQGALDMGKRWRESGKCTQVIRVISCQFLPAVEEEVAETGGGKGVLSTVNPLTSLSKLISGDDDEDCLNAIVDPFIEVRVEGVKSDTFTGKTRVVPDNGYCPRWDDTWSLPLQQKEHAILTLTVYHDTGGPDPRFLARGSIPVSACQLGYRALFLYDEDEKRLSTCPTILCHFREVIAGDPVEKANQIKKLETMRDETRMMAKAKQQQLHTVQDALKTNAKVLSQLRIDSQKAERKRDKYRRASCLVEDCVCVLQ